MTKRIEYIDLAKGFCILLVVFSHVSHFFIDDYYGKEAISSFRMPLYFFLSGLFFKSYNNFLDFFIRKTNKLLIPFLFFYAVTSVILPNICYYLGSDLYDRECTGIDTLWSFIHPERMANRPIWFLWCLFLMNIIFYKIYEIANRSHKYNNAILILVTIFIGISGYYLYYLGIDLPGYLDSAMTALPFFMFGYFFRARTNILYPNKYDKYNLLFAFLCLLFILFLGKSVIFESNNFGDVSLLRMYSTGLIGTLFILFFSKYIKQLPIISYCGRYSIIILVFHYPILKVVKPYIIQLQLNAWGSIILLWSIIIGINIGLIWLCKMYLPHVCAQKDIINEQFLLQYRRKRE